MLYKDWLNEWLENYVKPSSKERTYKMYVKNSYNHIIPKLGNYRIDQLTPIMVQRYISELINSGNIKTGQGLSPNSVNSIITVIQGSLKMAYMIGVSDRYEMDKLKRPKIQEKEINCFTIEEQKKIEQAVLIDKRRKMKGILVCLYTGIRIGELLALEWSDIDFEKKEMTINKTCHDSKNENGKYYRQTGTPKTTTSKRIIPITNQLIPILKSIKRASLSPYVINQDSGIISVRSYQRSFELLLKRQNISHHNFHSLRHTFATRALECGMDVKTLSEILGHKNPTITLNRYTHSMTKHKREMMNLIGKLLK